MNHVSPERDQNARVIPQNVRLGPNYGSG